MTVHHHGNETATAASQSELRLCVLAFDALTQRAGKLDACAQPARAHLSLSQCHHLGLSSLSRTDAQNFTIASYREMAYISRVAASLSA